MPGLHWKSLTIKVNLKKYLKIEGRWQFVPRLRKYSPPKPPYVVLNSDPGMENDEL